MYTWNVSQWDERFLIVRTNSKVKMQKSCRIGSCRTSNYDCMIGPCSAKKLKTCVFMIHRNRRNCVLTLRTSITNASCLSRLY